MDINDIICEECKARVQDYHKHGDYEDPEIVDDIDREIFELNKIRESFRRKP